MDDFISMDNNGNFSWVLALVYAIFDVNFYDAIIRALSSDNVLITLETFLLRLGPQERWDYIQHFHQLLAVQVIDVDVENAAMSMVGTAVFRLLLNGFVNEADALMAVVALPSLRTTTQWLQMYGPPGLSAQLQTAVTQLDPQPAQPSPAPAPTPAAMAAKKKSTKGNGDFSKKPTVARGGKTNKVQKKDQSSSSATNKPNYTTTQARKLLGPNDAPFGSRWLCPKHTNTNTPCSNVFTRRNCMKRHVHDDHKMKSWGFTLSDYADCGPVKIGLLEKGGVRNAWRKGERAAGAVTEEESGEEESEEEDAIVSDGDHSPSPSGRMGDGGMGGGMGGAQAVVVA